jgi:hypothetical protein
VIHVRDFPTSPHSRSASIARQHPGATGDAFLSAKALMKVPSIANAGPPDDFVSRDDEGLFAFINTLRLSVKARVAAEQLRGLSLSEIVVQVREMVRLAERDADHAKPFPSRAIRALSRQAVAWCVEAYRPIVITAGDEFSAPANEFASRSVPLVPELTGAPTVRIPAQSPNSRDLP